MSKILGSGGNRPRRSKNSKFVTTRSGNQLKVNRSLGEKWTAKKEQKAQRKAMRLQGLPKSRFKRVLWRMHPKRLAAYWFSRDGAIMALKITGIGILALFIITLIVFAYFRKDLPNITDISGSNLGGSISYYDRTGQTLLWQDYNAVKRVPVNSNEISQTLKDATIATEDRNFYKEKGFDIKSITRAAINNTFNQGGTQGGSTITQQLVKITQDWTQQRSLTRKAKELILAVELERTYSKDEILTGYLNAVPYGGVDYGAQAAAADYFHKSAKDLDLPESAMLAAIPKSPSVYSPYNTEYFDKQAFLGRYNYVLDSMVDTGKITKEQAEKAKKTDILARVQPQQTKYAGIKAPYFVLAAKNQLYDPASGFVPNDGKGSAKIGGWKVITTLDTNLQSIAEQKVQDNRANALRAGADEAALVAEDVKTGQMVALVGGTDFDNPDHGAINYAQWNISPGSSFKPYDYASLIENSNGAGAGSVLYDVQGALPGYPCTVKGLPPPKGNSNCLQDYDFRYPGPVTLRYALGGSRNVPAVKAMLTVGTDKVIKTANSMMASPGAYKCYKPGVDVNTATTADETQCYGASAIGDGAYLHLDKHVNGLATMARMGSAIPQTYILKIYDSKSSTKPIYEWKQPKGTQAIRQDAAYIVNDMASDPKASYLPVGYYKWHNYNGWRTAIKTGTTNNGFDGLMTAWNTQFAVGSWVGYHTRNKALSGTMETLTTPLTKGFMTAALDSLHTQPTNWTEPKDIQHQPGYVVSTHIGVGSQEPSPSTEIYPSWYKPKGNTSANATIDKISNKLATDCTPSLAKQTTGGNSTADHFSIDIYYGKGGAAANTSANDDVHSCSDARPTVSVFVNGTDVTEGGSASCPSSCSITATVSAGTHPLNDSSRSQYPGTVNLLINGQIVQSQGASDPSDTKTFTYAGSGSVTVAVQVIDSVLFDTTSAAATINFASASPGIGGLTISGSGGTRTFNWNGGTGPFSVHRSSVNGPVVTGCSGVSGQSCTGSGIVNNTTYYVVDATGQSDNDNT
jgi:membrane peptidoglycan carboxypeptidase